jgi:hypothetical protein
VSYTQEIEFFTTEPTEITEGKYNNILTHEIISAAIAIHRDVKLLKDGIRRMKI